jgi:Aspartyl protease/PDZ domain
MKRLAWCLLVVGAVVATAFSQASPSLPLSVPFDFENNQIYLRVGINGHEPGWFVLDSGASGCVIDTTVAKRLGLAMRGNESVRGAGRGAVKLTFTDNVTYDVAGLRVRMPQSYVIDLSGQPAIVGREIAGILGYDFFTRYVITIDYDAAIVTFAEPAHFSYGSGAVVPFTLVKKTPRINVQVTVANGRPSVDRQVMVDSGSEDPLDDDSLANAPIRLETLSGVGLGQEYRSTIARAQKLTIGPFTLEQPFGSTGGVPLIGTEVLRRFHVIFDYARTRIILEPNRHFRDAFAFDASGLDLRWAPDSFVIHDVAKPSAAAAAGLQAGDTIVAINGLPRTAIAAPIARVHQHSGARSCPWAAFRPRSSQRPSPHSCSLAVWV